MKRSDFSQCMELCASVKEALNYMEQSKNTDLLEDCVAAIQAITELLWLEDNTPEIQELLQKAGKVMDGMTLAVKEEEPEYNVIGELFADFYDQCRNILNAGNTKRAILIGAEEESIPCVKQFEKNNMAFCFCEEFLHGKNSKIYETISIKEISQKEEELIVVTARQGAEAILDFLLKECAIQRERILLFWNMYECGIPMMVCDRVMQNPGTASWDGIILGISHAEVGIIKEHLLGKCCNLSVSSQDLYFQYKTLEYCVEKYYQKIKNLKYAIIDLYDYHYFNYDVSYSRLAANYLFFGGYHLDPHNYEKNKLKPASFEKTLEHLKALKTKNRTETEAALWEELFSDIYECAEYEGFCSNFDILQRRMKVVTKEEVEEYQYDRSTVTKIRKETILCNTNALQKMLQLLKLINPELKIYTIIIPKYIETERRDEARLKVHKDYFEKIIKDLQTQYDFCHLDFKELSQISSSHHLYYDAAHLNYLGAMAFTEELKNRLDVKLH